MNKTVRHVAASLARDLERAGIAYLFVGPTALALQGVAAEPNSVAVTVQWDRFESALDLLHGTTAERTPTRATSYGEREGAPIRLACRYNTVVAADPDRVPVLVDGQRVWAQSVAAYRREAQANDPFLPAIESYLAQLQREHSQANAIAWNQSTYDAWVERYGRPAEAAARIAADPAGRLAPLGPYLGDLAGKRVINLLGSHGSKAVALALLGADVTVVDISAGNAAYAQDLAAAAGVSLRYVVSDVLALPEAELTGDYEVVLLELGILHYFIDLRPLARVIKRLLAPGGRLILHDFHPVSTKLITSTGKRHKVSGNYFETGLEEIEVAYNKYLPADRQGELKKVRHRKWTLGEIVTAIAAEGLFIRSLDELPNTKADDAGIPKTFILVAERLPQGGAPSMERSGYHKAER